MTAEYVRGFYDIPPSAKVGARVRVDGKPGVIVSFPDQYLGIRFAGEKRTSRCHPTWRVEYLCPLCDGPFTRDGVPAGKAHPLGRWRCEPCCAAEAEKAGGPALAGEVQG